MVETQRKKRYIRHVLRKKSFDVALTLFSPIQNWRGAKNKEIKDYVDKMSRDRIRSGEIV